MDAISDDGQTRSKKGIPNINFLLWKYKTKQPGEINPKNIDLKKE
ncbi:hypothetical protein GCM10025860_21570 [Methanobacterium ferruginis]|nr:hypothetical protein GCM10025860_21570 [Methanobacterium ferruginis]